MVSETVEAKGPLYPDYLRESRVQTQLKLYELTRIIAFYDPLEKVEMVGPFEHDDPGHRADPSFPNLLEKATNVLELSPHCGTELQGVQIVRFSAPTKKKKQNQKPLMHTNLVGAFKTGLG